MTTPSDQDRLERMPGTIIETKIEERRTENPIVMGLLYAELTSDYTWKSPRRLIGLRRLQTLHESALEVNWRRLQTSP